MHPAAQRTAAPQRTRSRGADEDVGLHPIYFQSLITQQGRIHVEVFTCCPRKANMQTDSNDLPLRLSAKNHTQASPVRLPKTPAANTALLLPVTEPHDARWVHLLGGIYPVWNPPHTRQHQTIAQTYEPEQNIGNALHMMPHQTVRLGAVARQGGQ